MAETTQPIIDYTPQQPKQQSAPAPEYALVEDVTGKPAPKRGPQLIRDMKNHVMKVPFAPKPNCKRCYGRGYVGNDAKTGDMIVCVKCYPIPR